MNTTFIDGTTPVMAEWLNEVNDAVFDAIGNGVTTPTTPAAVKVNLGLDQVDNTSDLDKPISTATQTALTNETNARIAADALKADKTYVDSQDALKSNITTTVTKDSSTGAGNLPAGTTAQRPGSPTVGGARFNTSVTSFEIWDGSTWNQPASTSATQTFSNKTLDSTCNLSGASGQLAGFRNKLINGGGLVSQRGLSTAVISTGVYGADRWISYLTGGTSISAITGGDVFGIAGTSSKNYIYISGTWTNGIAGFAQRIEGINSYGLNGKQVTVSGKIYHTVGSNQNFNVKLYKPTALDNYTSTTLLGTVSVNSVPSSTVIAFQATFTLGSTDASLGLQVSIELASAISATSKIVGITDVQLEEGSIATTFEQRPIGLELSLCQRYWEKVNYDLTSYASAAGQFSSIYVTWPEKRVSTTPTTITVSGSTNVSYNSAQSVNAKGAAFYFTSVAAGTTRVSGTAVVDAEL